MKICFMFVIVLVVLLGACTVPAATLAPTIMPSATVQPSATPTATPLPTFTPEPTATPEPFLLQDGALVDGQGQPVELAVPLLPGIQLNEVRNLVDGVFEAYDTEDRLMLVNDGTGWVTAPLGMNLEAGVWRVWDTENRAWTPEWNVADFNERIAELRLLVDETLVHPENFKTGEMQCIAPELCFHMQVKPEMAHEGYLMLLDAFAHTTSPTLRKYFREIGFSGNTGEQLERFLQTSLSPDGKPYWLPAVSPKGTEFRYVQDAVGTGRGRYRNSEYVKANGGLHMTNLSIAVYPIGQWQDNLWVRSWVEWIKKMNSNRTEKLLIRSAEWSEWGLVVHPITGELLFLAGHREPGLSNDDMDRQLGGVLGEFRPDLDISFMDRTLSAYMLNYPDKMTPLFDCSGSVKLDTTLRGRVHFRKEVHDGRKTEVQSRIQSPGCAGAHLR